MGRARKSTVVAALVGLLVSAGFMSVSAADAPVPAAQLVAVSAQPTPASAAVATGLVALVLVQFGAAIARRRRTPARA
jgi:hypothetical protein